MGLYEDQLFGAIESVAQRVVDRNGADITVHGEVIKLVNVEVGEYKVKYEGNIFSAYSESPTTVYQDGDDVYVLVPSANFNNKKIILGHASFENSTTNTDINDMTNKYIPLGPNWLSDSTYRPSIESIGITAAQDRPSSNERAEIKVSPDGGRSGGAFWNYAFARSKDNIADGYGIVSPYEVSSPEYPVMIMMSPEALSKADSLIQSYGANANTLMIQADFRTEFIDIHNFGEYKLVVETLEESPNYIDLASEIARLQEGQKKYEKGSDIYKQYQTKIDDLQEQLESYENRYTIIAHELGFADFIGQPYLYPVDTPNTAYISVKPGTVRGLVAVYLMQDGDMSADRESTVSDSGLPAKGSKVLDRMNIFASNINIQFAKKVDLLDNLYYSWIEQPEGNEVYSGGITGDESAKLSTLLRAKLYYGYKDILEEDTCQVYWFRENAIMTRYEYDLLDEKINRPPLPNPLNYDFTEEQIEKDEDTGIVIPNSANRAERDQNPPPVEPTPEDPNYEDDYKTYRRYLFWVDLEKYEDWTATKDEWGKTYFDYSGPGWTPIKWIMDQRSEDMETYEISFDELRVPKEEVPIQWQYKVVIVYNGDTRVEEDPTAMIYNTDAAAAGLVFSIQEFNDSALKKEYLRVLDETYPQNKISADGNPEAGTPPQYPNEEYARWYLSLTDGTYDEITKRGEQYDIGEGRELEQKGFLRDLFFGKNTETTDDDVTITVLEGPKHITNYMTRTFLHFNAALYYSDTMEAKQKTYLNGLTWDKSEPIANLSYDIITEEGLNFLVTWEGQDTFIYNSDGSIMTEDADVNHTLTYRLNWQNGNGDNYSVTVLGPGRNVLTNEPSKETTSFGSMMTNMWTPVPSNEINFKVRQEFDSSKTENYFILKISSSIGQTWEIRKDIAFLKNGNQGSNGTNWFAPIYPTNWEAIESHAEPFTQKIITQEKPIKVVGEDLDKAHQITAELEVTDPYGLPTGDWNHLVLRPFVTKNGQDIATLTEAVENGDNVSKKQYYYDVYWDVRYPNNNLVNPDIKGNSRLRILKDIKGDHSKLEPFEQYDSDVTEPGLIAIRSTKTNLISDDKTYGQIEVIFKGVSENVENPALATPYIKDCNYNFYIKATVNIYEHLTDSVGTESDSKVATITSYYPVDILMVNSEDAAKKFDDYYLTCNWPKNIKYNVTGYNPIGRLEPMVMRYEKDNISSELVEPITLTEKLLQINQEEEIEYVDGEPIKTGEYEYTCKPRPYNFWVDNHHAAISGDIKLTETVYDKNKALEELRTNDSEESNAYEIAKAAFNNPNDAEAIVNFEAWLANQTDTSYVKTDFFTLDNEPIYNLTTENSLGLFTYYRTIIMDLDIYGGNMAINGWDGTRIDINQDQGTIFAPTIGAGYKDPFKNTFTGVIMGIDTSQVKPGKDANYAKFPVEETEKNNYMTGLYGYQDGVISFGIMENGTAFFGRADRGGRIVIDGHNAQIYGGLTEDSNRLGGDRDIDMSNRMRLSFIDFDGISLDNYISTEDNNILVLPIKDSDGKIIKTVEINLNETQRYKQVLISQKIPDSSKYQQIKTYEEDSNGDYICYKKDDEDEGKYYLITDYQNQIKVDDIDIIAGAFNVKNFATYFQPETNNNLLAAAAGFGSGRGYSTPAIEIGSYENYLLGTTYEDENQKPSGQDLIREITIDEIKKNHRYESIKSLEIPGYRKFLVTYDGTMYAMNAFIKGNLVSSNIIGSQFFNGDGTFAVTENGNLGIGKNENDWSEEVVHDIYNPGELHYSELWSHVTPQTYPKYVSEYLIENTGAHDDFTSGHFSFFVSSDGTVLCQNIHIAGGSLNIGDFHIIGEKENETTNMNTGDVVSFGTMYLVGNKNNSGTPPGENEYAVQAWGDFYLRGALVNLGKVLLGGSPEKYLPTVPGENSNYSPNTYNSPFSLIPGDTYKDITFNGPNPPLEGAFWPLHFYMSKDIIKKDEENGKYYIFEGGSSWVNLPVNRPDTPSDGFMPTFGARDRIEEENKLTFPGLGSGTKNALFRVDSNGLWSDLIFFRRFSGAAGKYDAPIGDTEKMKNPEVALGFLLGNAGEAGTTLGFGIRNISRDAPQMIFETVGDARISAGVRKYDNEDKSVGDTSSDENKLKGKSLYLETRQDGDREKLASGIFIGGQARSWSPDGSGTLMGYSTISENSGVIGLFTNQFYGSPQDGDKLQALLVLGGIGVAGQQIDPLTKEVVGLIPKHNAGQIWGRGRGITLETLSRGVDLDNIDEDAGAVSIRLSRTKTGAPSMDWNETTFQEDGLLYIRAKNMVLDIPAANQYGIYARFG